MRRQVLPTLLGLGLLAFGCGKSAKESTFPIPQAPSSTPLPDVTGTPFPTFEPLATPAPPSTPAPPATPRPPARPTSAPAAQGCRNSTDPKCGSFTWDPDPGGSRGLRLEAEVSNKTPAVGEKVVFTVKVSDPDAKPFFGTFDIGGKTLIVDDFPGDCARAYGAWTPPKRSGGSDSRSHDRTWDKPGKYKVFFTAFSHSPDSAWPTSARPGDKDGICLAGPYDKNARVDMEIEVRP